jgi:mono/diheme cytochrome c family protein
MFTQKTSRSIAVIAGILALALGAGTGVAQEAIDYGKAQFMDRCAICHGVTGAGDGAIGQLFAKKPRNLTLLAKDNNGVFLFSEVYQAIDGQRKIQGHGSSEMPVWGDYFLAEALPRTVHPGIVAEEVVQGRILSLVYYLQTIQKR